MKEMGLKKKILRNNTSTSLFGFLNKQQRDLSTLFARVAVVEKENQNLKERNHCLKGAKEIIQAMHSQVLKNYQTINSIYTRKI